MNLAKMNNNIKLCKINNLLPTLQVQLITLLIFQVAYPNLTLNSNSKISCNFNSNMSSINSNKTLNTNKISKALNLFSKTTAYFEREINLMRIIFAEENKNNRKNDYKLYKNLLIKTNQILLNLIWSWTFFLIYNESILISILKLILNWWVSTIENEI